MRIQFENSIESVPNAPLVYERIRNAFDQASKEVGEKELPVDEVLDAAEVRLIQAFTLPIRTQLGVDDLIIYRGSKHLAVCIDHGARLAMITAEPAPAPVYNERYTVAEIREQVADARRVAERQAREACGHRAYLKSRGTCVTSCKDNEVVISTGDAHEFSFTRKEIERLVARAKEEGWTGIYLEGGHDCYESFQAFTDGWDYDPWVSTWVVNLWTPERGFLPDLQDLRLKYAA